MINTSRDSKMWAVERLVLKAAACRANVLLQGESGVGKAFIARRIHRASSDAGRGFFSLFCLPGTDLVPGTLSPGRDLADICRRYGTVHLRGIDLLDAVGQRDLLALLDSRERDLAGPGSCATSGRLIFSSQRDLKAETEAGRYLSQLYLRVSVITIDVPPLRQRGSDIVNLARHFLHLYALRECKTIRGLSPDAARLLCRLSWEGNIHELKNAMNRAAVMADDGAVLNAGTLKNLLAHTCL
jgi:DNA-binding NtrC family response regulator